MRLNGLSPRSTQRVWWLAVGVILLIGGYLHLSGYNYGLNLLGIGAVDEERIYQDAYYQMHHLTDKITLPGYPPGILAIDYAAHLTLQARYNQPERLFTVEGVYLVRLWAGISNLITGLCLMLIGRALKHPLTGLLAALIFFSSTTIVQNTVVALAEGFQAAAITLTLYLTLLALTKKQRRYLLLATITALIATLIKYPAAITLGIPIAATLWLIAFDNRRRWGAALLLEIGLIAAVGGWLIYGYGAARLQAIGGESLLFETSLQAFQSNPIAFFASLPIAEILTTAAAQIQLAPLLMGLLVAGGVLVYWREASGWQRALVIGTGLFYLAWCLLVPLYLDISLLMSRYVIPISPVGALLVALGITSIILWLAQRIKQPVLGYGLVSIIALVWLLPHYSDLYTRARELALPSTSDAYLNWVHRALPTDGTLLIRNVDWLFFTQNDTTELTVTTRTWYQGHVPERRRADWLKDVIIYAYVEDYELEQLKQQPGGEEDLANMLVLKSFPAPEERTQYRGPDISIYRLFPMQHTASTTFGEQIRWVGYDLNQMQLKAGETLTFAPYWQAIATPPTDYNIYLHLVPSDSRDVLVQADGQPARGADYPTSQWNDPREVVIGSEFKLALPADIPPGTYRLIMGVYDWQNGQRLATTTGEDYVPVAEIEVIAAGES